MDNKLPKEFYLQDTIDVARGLIGKKLVHVLPDGRRLSGMITETEAYLGNEDPACHSFGSRLTERTAPMFEDGGIAYIYFIYGMYYCFNVVARGAGHPEAALVRALEPLEGLETMRMAREKDLPVHQIANGPGKLCRALMIDKSLNGLSLWGERLYIADHKSFPDKDIADSPRIGIGYAEDAVHWPLRFLLANHPTLTPQRKASN